MQHELGRMKDHELLLSGIFIAGQCAALEDLSAAGLSDQRIERLATLLRRQADMLDCEGRSRGLNLYGEQIPGQTLLQGQESNGSRG